MVLSSAPGLLSCWLLLNSRAMSGRGSAVSERYLPTTNEKPSETMFQRVLLDFVLKTFGLGAENEPRARIRGHLSRTYIYTPSPWKGRVGSLRTSHRIKQKKQSVWTASSFERKTRLELATPTLARLCSTNWAISAVHLKFTCAMFFDCECKGTPYFLICKFFRNFFLIFCKISCFCPFFGTKTPKIRR